MKHIMHNNPTMYRKGEEHPNAKLTADDVREIRRLYATTYITQVELCKRYGISKSQIGRIVNNWCWESVV